MVTKLLPLLILLFLVKTSAYSQQFKHFTNEPKAYFDEMKDLFARDETNYKKGKELLDEFEEPWLEGGFTKEEQENIYELSNLLLKRRARNFPHFYNFIQTILAFKQSDADSSNYIAWQQGLRFLTSQRKIRLSQIDNFTKTVYYLITKRAVYYTKSISWYTNNNNYKLLLDKDTLKIVFPNLTLTGKLRKDSIQIHETSGVYYPLTKIWKGNSAKIYWEKCGISRDTAWAEIDNYQFPMNKASYTLKNVRFYNKNYFDYPLVGTLTDKIVEVTNINRLTYPRFTSYEANFSIDSIFKDINYKGGFSMHGSSFLGTGDKVHPARLDLYRDIKLVIDGDTIIKKQLFMTAQAFVFSFKDNDIVSRNCKITMHIEDDSIYHPGLLFRYYNKNREIDLIRNDDPENMSRSPYYDTYHKIEMDFELLKWNMDDDNIAFTMLRGSSINTAKFESQNYFSASRYYEVQGLEQIHPYISLRRFARLHNTNTIYDEDLAKYMRYGITPVRRMLIDFTYRGIVDYDLETGYFTIQPKLYNYLDAIVGRIDYDLIIFESQVTAPKDNAILNLKNMDLEIEGVPMLNVSDSQNVVFYPENDRILFKKNRNIDFNGKIEVGYFTFYGNNFEFNYDKFRVELNNVDSLSIKVKAGTDNWGRKVLNNVENVIEDVTGYVVIDEPDNKSGIKSNPRYPFFESKKNSYVYYDAPTIQKGKYVRDTFYFEVYPYTIDSLNNFSTEGMGYEGELHSAGIFPIIEQKLVLQPDNSLGFHHDTPEDGLPLYAGKGQYYSDINLSNQGLRGNGHMTYLTSEAYSDDFIFYPDSVNTITNKFTIGKQVASVQYPEVNIEKANFHWMPYLDELYTQSKDAPFNMYEQKVKHSGELVYTPNNLTGSGTMDYYNSLLSSGYVEYQADKFNADTAAFTLKSVNPDKLALKTNNVNAKVDFIEMKSSFRSNTGTSEIDLQENLYKAYVERFSWMMLEQTLQLSTPNTVQVLDHGKTKIVSRDDAGLTPKGSLFLSVHSGQDSLNWISEIADFDLKTNTIYAHKVKYIDVADATVLPAEGEVVIEPKAYMKTLLNAEIIANRETQYHYFHDATVNINSRKKYFASGQYDYKDYTGQINIINFDLIAVDSTEQTFARGTIKGIDDFTLSPEFGYRGKVSLKANVRNLYFDGYTRINHNCKTISRNWLSFETEIDPNNIYIPVSDKPKDINDAFLVSGAMLATDSIHVFPAFLSPRKRYSNLAVMTAKGFLKYDTESKQFIIAEKYRILNNDTTGNILRLQKNSCLISGEGDINLTADLGQVKVETKGNGFYKVPEDKLRLDLFMTVDFFFPDACVSFIADTLATMTGLKSVSLKSRTYVQGVKELLPGNEAVQILREQSIFGTVKKVPDKLSTTFVFSNLGMVWNKKTTSWNSTGKLGIVNIGGKQINKKVNGYLSITKKRSGDSFDLYIEISKDHWYYFNYSRGLMQAYSSEPGFNEIITNTKGSDRKMKVQRGETSYVFFLSNQRKKDKFLEKITGKTTGKSEVDSDNEKEPDVDYEKYDDFD